MLTDVNLHPLMFDEDNFGRCLVLNFNKIMMSSATQELNKRKGRNTNFLEFFSFAVIKPVGRSAAGNKWTVAEVSREKGHNSKITVLLEARTKMFHDQPIGTYLMVDFIFGCTTLLVFCLKK